jgi:hypothetical protein
MGTLLLKIIVCAVLGLNFDVSPGMSSISPATDPRYPQPQFRQTLSLGLGDSPVGLPHYEQNIPFLLTMLTCNPSN